MREEKIIGSFLRSILVIAITLVFVLPGSIAFSFDEEITEQNQAIVGIPKLLTSVDVSVSHISSANPIITQESNGISLGTDTLIWKDMDNDCQNPAVVTDGLDNVLVLFEIVEGSDHTSSWGRWSTNGGETWSTQASGWQDISPRTGWHDSISRSKLDFYEGKWAYGTWTAGSRWHGAAYYVELPDITDPTYDPNGHGWVYYSSDWETQQFSDFDSADVACYPYDASTSPNSNFWGCTAITGDRPPGDHAEDDTIMFSYFLPGDQATLISFYNMYENVDKITCAIDESLGQFYMVMEYVNETDSTDNGTYFMKAPPFRPDDYFAGDYWWDGNFTVFLFEGVHNPDIVTDDNGSVYIIGETVVDDHNDIMCLYSYDAGENFESSIITVTATDDENYPCITVVGDTVVCTYIRNGDLCSSVSIDRGVSWIETERVNDIEGSTVEHYSSNNVYGQYGAWTDDRSSPDPTEIYFDIIDVDIPILEIRDISGGIGVNAIIENIGTANATNVKWTITVTGGLLHLINVEKNGTIKNLAIGEQSEPVKTRIFFGLGKINITVAADRKEKTATGKQIIIFTIIS